MKEILTPDFEQAILAFSWLRERDFPRRTSFKLVCDRYRLNRFQRVILYHSIFPESEACARQARQVMQIRRQHLWIDGFNVLFTVVNYLLGRPVFISCDGVLRDAGEAFAKPDQPEQFTRSALLCRKTLEELQPASITIVLDTQVPACSLIHGILDEQFKGAIFIVDIHCTNKADRYLLSQRSGILASSDSEILDGFDGPWLDLAASILQQMGGGLQFVNFKELVGKLKMKYI
jgi:hypothetical protein